MSYSRLNLDTSATLMSKYCQVFVFGVVVILWVFDVSGTSFEFKGDYNVSVRILDKSIITLKQVIGYCRSVHRY